MAKVAERFGAGRRPERPSLAERWVELRDRLLDSNGLHREESVVDRETIRVSIARAAVGLGLTREELDTFERQFVRHLIPVRTTKDPQFDLFALPHLIDAEMWVGSDIEARAVAKPAAPTWGARHHAMAEAKVRLSREQRDAVTAMCEPTGWANLIGRAGTGKTTVLRTVAQALRDSYGHDEAAADQVIVVSSNAIVAQRSGHDIDADRTYSIDGFAAAVRTGLSVTNRTWIFLDEAAMVDTPHMKMLLEAAGPAVIRAIGDDRQLPAIGPAGWYAEQLDRNGGPELTYVYRQRNADDVRDFTDLGAGRVEEAVRSLDARNRIIVVDERGQRAQAIVDLYLQERMRGRGARDVGVVVDGIEPRARRPQPPDSARAPGHGGDWGATAAGRGDRRRPTLGAVPGRPRRVPSAAQGQGTARPCATACTARSSASTTIAGGSASNSIAVAGSR